MRQRSSINLWQSFADLAMGLMAVFILVLILLLNQKEQMLQEQEQSAEEFAKKLLEALRHAGDIVDRQANVNDWISRVLLMETECGLQIENGVLRIRDEQTAAELYDSGKVTLRRDAQEALRSCAYSFLVLATCLNEVGEETGLRCEDLLAEQDDLRNDVAEYRDSIEALILQGNTDREPLKSEGIRPIHGVPSPSGAIYRRFSEDPARYAQAFVKNAYLGSERARQALGHVFYGVERAAKTHGYGGTDYSAQMSALSSLARHIRIESPSFGLKHGYLPSAQVPEGQCDPNINRCDSARNLSLRLQWKRDSLRKPFREMQDFFCFQWADTKSALHRGLVRESDRQEAERICAQRDKQRGEEETP